MFKPDPKTQVSLKYQELFGRDARHKVEGARMDERNASRLGLPKGVYYVTVTAPVHGVVASASSRDWRKAYKLLKLEVEKLFADGHYPLTSPFKTAR